MWMSGQTMSGKMVLGRCRYDAGADNVGVGGAGGPSRVGKGKIGESDGGGKNVRADMAIARGPGTVRKGFTCEDPVREGTIPLGSHDGGSGVALWHMDGYDVFVIDIYSCDRP